ncbi:MAG: triphosphoribosyl-dephospho-CoA synthase [Planctomycetaceae bacterium]
MSEKQRSTAVPRDWSQQISQWVRVACEREVQSPKPGNVSPGNDFADATVADFLASADAIAPVMAMASERPLGRTILDSVEATRRVVGHNTNLGIILLIAPLAAVPASKSLSEGIGDILKCSSVDDSIAVYEAIRRAQPAGLGEVKDQDLQQTPTQNLVECMRLAADRDLIAAQYANGFRQVLGNGLRWLAEAQQTIRPPEEQITWLAVRFLAEFGDSLIVRKCGLSMSELVQRKARELLSSGWPHQPNSSVGLADLDTFLRADGNRRNPGTTADFIAAVIFAGLREGRLV